MIVSSLFSTSSTRERLFFFFTHTPTTATYTLSLHDALPIPGKGSNVPLYVLGSSMFGATLAAALGLPYAFASHFAPQLLEDRKSTRLNSSHMSISYAVFCLKKKNNHITTYPYITTHYVVGLH